MPDELFKSAAIAQQVEFAISRLESLSMSPSVATKILPKVVQGQFRPSSLADIVESDPALAVKVLSILGQKAPDSSDKWFSIVRSLDKMSAYDFRNAVMSINVELPSGLDEQADFEASEHKKGLLLHSLAVACCAREIASLASPQYDADMAYCAGLLHDIGKIALEQAMPKSLARIIEEAQSAKECSCTIERENLGCDHTIIGKHLCQKWRLPNPVSLAVWLHHSRTQVIAHGMPEARIAAIVQLADSVARQAGIGISGSFDLPEPVEPIARWLGVNSAKLQGVRDSLPEAVRAKSEILGLDMPNAVESYCRVAHNAATGLAREHAKLSDENRKLQTSSSHLNFITEFLISIGSSVSVADIAGNFASRWQKFYQTGNVCLYTVPLSGSQILEALVAQTLGQTSMSLVEVPDDDSAIPEPIAGEFAILNAYDHLDWLFEQLDVEFNRTRTKLLPLLSAGRAVGVIAFELFYPGDIQLFEENFKTSASIAGAVFDVALARRRQQNFAERFTNLISISPEQPQPAGAEEDSMSALAEMAAGAAHELNNPLAVISGRAQLLADAETDKEKREILEQIYQNAREASELIEDLMSFAEPRLPRPTRTEVRQLLEEAVQLTSRKINRDDMNVQINIENDVKNVFVDSAQIVSAIANIISNAAESYTGITGPIKITAAPEQGGELVKLTIRDQGCGISADILNKVTQPFFSAKTAGRKRGMGLAYAARFIQLNKGTLSIASEPGVGTNVTIYLPCR